LQGWGWTDVFRLYHVGVKQMHPRYHVTAALHRGLRLDLKAFWICQEPCVSTHNISTWFNKEDKRSVLVQRLSFPGSHCVCQSLYWSSSCCLGERVCLCVCVRERGVWKWSSISLCGLEVQKQRKRKRERVRVRGINQPWQISLCRGSSESLKKCWKAKRFAKRYFTLFYQTKGLLGMDIQKPMS